MMHIKLYISLKDNYAVMVGFLCLAKRSNELFDVREGEIH
jgi:hypothetical protein